MFKAQDLDLIAESSYLLNAILKPFYHIWLTFNTKN